MSEDAILALLHHLMQVQELYRLKAESETDHLRKSVYYGKMAAVSESERIVRDFLT